jgi:hypothetical protein
MLLILVIDSTLMLNMPKVITFMNLYVGISRFVGFSSKTRGQGFSVLMNSLQRVAALQGELVQVLPITARSELAPSSLSELISAEKCDFVE